VPKFTPTITKSAISTWLSLLRSPANSGAGVGVGLLSDFEKTQINKASEAAKEDLVVGETVAVFGQENQDGTVTAENIQLNPTEQFSRTGNP